MKLQEEGSWHFFSSDVKGLHSVGCFRVSIQSACFDLAFSWTGACSPFTYVKNVTGNPEKYYSSQFGVQLLVLEGKKKGDFQTRQN